MSDEIARWLRLAVLTVFSAALAAHAIAHSHFHVDDFAHFALSQRTAWLELAATPIDVHFAPLHRLASAWLYASFPMRFDVAVLLLASCHVAAFWLFERVLARIAPGAAGALALPLFAASVYAIVPLSYWTSGLHRFPYTLLCVAALWLWLRFRDSDQVGYAVATGAAAVGAAGFYSKGALVPLTVAALEASLWWRPAVAPPTRRIAALLALFAVLSVYAVAYASHPHGFAALDPSFDALAGMLAHGLRVVGDAPLTLVASPEAPVGLVAPLLWAAFAVVTTLAAPRNLVVWASFVTVIAAHLAMIGLSERAHDLGALTAYVYRYHFETALPIALLFALLARSLGERLGDRLPAWLHSPAWALGFTIAYAALSYTSATALMDARFGANRRAHDYVTNVLSEVERLEARLGAPITLIDGRVPRFLWVYDTSLRHHRTFLPLIGLRARFDTPDVPLHWIDARGIAREVVSVDRFALELSEAWGRPDARWNGIERDASGCLRVTGDTGGSARFAMPAPIPLQRAMLVVEYDSDVDREVWLNVSATERPLWPGRGHRLALPATQTARLLDVALPSGVTSIRIEALDLFVAADPHELCLHEIRLATYGLDASAAGAPDSPR